jgi:hypothetical protein
MKRYPINVARLHMLESGQFLNRFSIDFNNSGLDPDADVELKALLDTFTEQSMAYSEALMQTRIKLETRSLKTLNLIRNQKFSVVRRATKVHEYDDELNEKVAYNTLSLILKKYKTIQTATFETKSLGIQKFITALRGAKNDALNVLLLAGVVAKLEQANENFIVTFNTRSSENISDIKYDAFALRQTVFSTYKDLLEYVLVMAKRKKTPYYSTLLEVMNNGREYFADTLARRAGAELHHKMEQEKTISTVLILPESTAEEVVG